MRAIHNKDKESGGCSGGVSNMSKIRYESNSQPFAYVVSNRTGCFQYVKDTI